MQHNSYLSLKDIYQDEIAFVFGAGPSLFSDVYNNKSFKFLDNHINVTVNSGILFMPWMDGPPEKRFWISNDSLCRKWGYWDSVKKSHAIKIVRDSWLKYESELKDFLFFSPRPTSEDVINPEDSGLAYCSSVPSAIDLCLQMGCKKIYLLGVDHYALDGKSHAWQFLPQKDWPAGWMRLLAPQSQQEKVFNYYNNMAFKALKEFAKIKNAEIINCNLKSKVEIFDKISLEEMLSHESS